MRLPEIGGNTKDAFPVHHRGIGRSEIVRDQNVRLGQGQKWPGRFALEISNDPLGYILDVESALPQIRIIDLAQGFGITAGHFLEHPFHIGKIGFQLAQHLVDQGPVFHHQEVGVENSSVFCPDRFGDALLHFEDLHPRLNERGLEPPDLIRNLGGA